MSVVAVITDAGRAAPLARWAQRLAQRIEEPLIVARPEGERIATPTRRQRADGDAATPEQPSDQQPKAGALAAWGLDSEEVTVAPYADEAGLFEICNGGDVRYVLAEVPLQRDRRGPSLARRLFDRCANTTVLLRLGEEEGACGKILVPLLRGADNGAALRLAEALAKEGDRLTALAVEPRAFTEGEGVGRRWIQRELDAAGLADASAVEMRVELDDSVEAAIVRAAEQHELVLFGASGLGTQIPSLRSPRGQLLGLLPDRMVRGRTPLAAELALGVVRSRWSLGARMQLRLGRWLDVVVPQLDRDQRVGLTERLQHGSESNFDFLSLMALSTAIASLGLIQDSAAVVIGAMLVAPLMMPILGAGLAIVQGNLPLLRSAAKALLLGYAIALAISVAVGVITATHNLTPQLEARGNPNLLDLGGAFFSGLAAAYCLARPDLSAALPGVAIAAALVPPIATTGIALAAGVLEVATGALLLFLTNVAAIVVGAFISLYAGGLRPQSGSGAIRPWMRSAFLGVLVAVALLAWPLARASVERTAPEVTERAARVETIETVATELLAAGQRLVRVQQAPVASAPSGGREESGENDDALAVTLEIEAISPPARGQVDRLRSALSQALERPVALEVRTTLVARSAAD